MDEKIKKIALFFIENIQEVLEEIIQDTYSLDKEQEEDLTFISDLLRNNKVALRKLQLLKAKIEKNEIIKEKLLEELDSFRIIWNELDKSILSFIKNITNEENEENT